MTMLPLATVARIVSMSAVWIFSGCGVERCDDGVDTALRPAVVSFLSWARSERLLPLRGTQGDVCSATVTSLSAPTLGTCYTTGGFNYLKIDSGLLGDSRLETVVWHELTHCLYQLGHDSEPNRVMSAGLSPALMSKSPSQRRDELADYIRESL